MARFAFLGDEVSAAGFRLTGVATHVPRPDEIPALVRRLGEEVEVILLTAEVAAQLPKGWLDETHAADWPLVCVMPDIRGHQEPPDFAGPIRGQLGIG
ncbi:V-type ATP synthase subunit F [Thioalkalicoccus limnaeus]|uniref:V-type ATP synthase subunit F n=1 Tax=Thioalkalicoccus limnaeus TaxID=120681 RepID=A0ABV4BFX3_9GAMM